LEKGKRLPLEGLPIGPAKRGGKSDHDGEVGEWKQKEGSKGLCATKGLQTETSGGRMVDARLPSEIRKLFLWDRRGAVFQQKGNRQQHPNRGKWGMATKGYICRRKKEGVIIMGSEKRKRWRKITKTPPNLFLSKSFGIPEGCRREEKGNKM